jgi:phage shock protein PspC (stress-responsive transcriptional regulator)
VAFILFVMGVTALGVALGIGAAILGLMFSVLKVALMILVPIALIYFVAKVLMSPERTY